MKDVKKVIADLKKSGVEFVNDCVIKSTSLAQRSNGDTVIRVVLNKEVHAYVNDGEGVYTEGVSNVIYVAPFSLAKAIEECEEIAFLSSSVIANPGIVTAVLSYAKCDVICEPVTEGQDYINPFSNKETPKTVTNTNIYHHVVNIKPSKMGLMMADKVMEKMAFSVVNGGVDNNTREVSIEI